MQATICFVLLVALLCGTYSSAMLWPYSGQHADQNPPPAIWVPLTPAALPTSKHPRLPDPPQAQNCVITQLRDSTDICISSFCYQHGARCLIPRSHKKCQQHIVVIGGIFANTIRQMSWPIWPWTRYSCRGCGCMKALWRPRQGGVRNFQSQWETDESDS
jgi:hypothetical protein